MPQVEKVRKSHRKLYVSLVIGLVLLGACIAGGIYLDYRLVPSASTSVTRAQAFMNVGDYSEAESILKSAYSRALFTSDKEKILVNLAACENDAGNYQTALMYYEQLNSIQPHNASNVEMLALAAQQAGNKSVELQADEEALPFMESTRNLGPTKGADIRALEQQIQELKQ